MPTEKKTIFHQLDQLKKLQIQSKLNFGVEILQLGVAEGY